MLQGESSLLVMKPPTSSIRSPSAERRLPGLRTLVLLSALAFPWACSSDSSGPTPDPRVPTTMTAVEGVGLQAPARTVLPEGPTIQLLDQFGDPMQGVTVLFQVVEGGGSAPVSNVSTDTQGRARGTWILGPISGSGQRLRASAGALAVDFQASAVEAVPGQSYLGRAGYTQYLAGDLPLVLSAPHGGDLTPAEIPDRTYGTTGQDRNTLDLALRIREAIKTQTGSYPHIILSRLHRTKLDPNREIVEAAQGDPESERAWWEFQTFIEAAEEMVAEDYGRGFYIDLHGHGHEIQRLELGYLLTSADLANPNEVLSGSSFADKSSLRALAQTAGIAFADLVRGPTSLRSPPGGRVLSCSPEPEPTQPWNRSLLQRWIQYGTPRIQGRRVRQRRADRMQLHRCPGHRSQPPELRGSPGEVTGRILLHPPGVGTGPLSSPVGG